MENLFNQTRREPNDSQTLDKVIMGCFVSDSQPVVVTRVLVYVVIMIASLIGNCVVIRLVKKEGRSRSSTSFYIANLSVCALFFSIVYMPRVISLILRGYQWLVLGLLGTLLCKSVIFFDYLALSVSILTVMIISLERCVVVAFPYKSISITTRFSKLMVVSTWLVGVLTQWPYLYSTELVSKDGVSTCYINLDKAFGFGAKQRYYKFSLIAMYFIPLVITTVAYAVIVVKLKRRKKLGDCTISSRRERQNRQIIYMVLTVVTLFVLCWLLYFIFLVLYAYQITVPCEVLFMRLFLAHLNSAITPYVYTKFSARYRRAFAAIVAPCCYCFCQDKLRKLRGKAEASYRMQIALQETNTSTELSNAGCSMRK